MPGCLVGSCGPRSDADDHSSIPSDQSERDRLAFQQYGVFPPPLPVQLQLASKTTAQHGATELRASKTSCPSHPQSFNFSDSEEPRAYVLPRAGRHGSPLGRSLGDALSPGVKSQDLGITNKSGPHPVEQRAVDPLEVAWRRVGEQRVEVASIRVDIWKARRRLVKARMQKDAADNALMSLLRPLLADCKEDSISLPRASVLATFQEMQKSRDTYQDCETSLEALEMRLDVSERELDIMERKLINDLRPTDTEPLQDIIDPEPETLHDIVDPELPEALLGLTTEKRKDYHPLFEKLLSTIDSLELAERHHYESTSRKCMIEEEVEHLQRLAQRKTLSVEAGRDALKMAEQQEAQLTEAERERLIAATEYHLNSDNVQETPLQDEDLEFMQNFEAREKESLVEIFKLRAEIERLKQDCQTDGVIPRYPALHELLFYQQDLEDDCSVTLDPEEDKEPAGVLGDSPFTTLLQNPTHLLENPPITAKFALERAKQLKDDDPQKQPLLDAAAKENYMEDLGHHVKPGDISDLINRWLLHSLRISPLQALLLYNHFLEVTCLESVDLERWQDDVLCSWSRDEAAKRPFDHFIGPLTSVSGASVTPLRAWNSDIAVARSETAQGLNAGSRSYVEK